MYPCNGGDATSHVRSTHRDIGYVPPTDTGSLCLAVDSTHTVVGLFRLLVRRSGTHCQMNSEIRPVMSTASNSSLKQSCSALTSVTRTLEVIFNVMRSINPRFTYLLTYLLTTAVSYPANIVHSQRRRRSEKLGARGCNFPTQKIRTFKISILPLIFPQNEGFSAPNLVFLK